jgi:hypothetical protein
MKFFFPSVIFCVVLISGTASADPILPTLAPGTPYRVAFVTNGTRDATSTDIQDYHDFVASQAASEPILAALGTTWKAIAATDAAQSARTNSGTTGVGNPIYLLDGSSTPLVNSFDDLWDGSIDRLFNVNQHGDVDTLDPNANRIWTGSNTDGERAFGSQYLGTGFTLVGRVISTNHCWIQCSSTAGSVEQAFIWHLGFSNRSPRA